MPQSLPAKSMTGHPLLPSSEWTLLPKPAWWLGRMFPCVFKVRRESEKHKYGRGIAAAERAWAGDPQKQS